MKFSPVLIFDIIAVAILVISSLVGRRRGLIKTVSGIIALILAFYIAGVLAKTSTPVVSEKYIAPYINQAVEKENGGAPAETPEEIATLFSAIGIPDGIVSDAITDISHTFSQSIMESISEISNTVAYKITHAVLFVIFFVLSLILLTLLMKLVNLASRIPGINFINKTFGLILGLILGYLIIVLLSQILIKSGLYLTEDILADTTVLKFITSFYPFAFFAK